MIRSWKYKAGRELDALVAKEFLEWTHDDSESINRYWFDGEGNEVRLEFFSSEDDSAFHLLKLLRQSGDWCCIDVGTDYHYLWSIKITPGYGLDNDPADKHEALLCFEGEKFAQIICNAVVEAARFKASLKHKHDSTV